MPNIAADAGRFGHATVDDNLPTGFAGPGGLTGRALSPSDSAALCALSDEAGWNQTARDWAAMLSLGRGYAYWEANVPVATALALPYAPVAGRAERPIGFVSMVLTTARWQRRGLARDLTQRCVAALEAAGCVPALDATPAGREVYRTIGFADGPGLDRWRAAAPTAPASSRADAVLRPIVMIAPALAALDALCVGGARPAVLRELLARRPDLAWAAWRGGDLVGFCLGRDGRTATQIGPVIASDPAIGAVLIAQALARTRGPVIVDLMRTHGDIARLLAAAGFAPVREFTRMVRGGSVPAAPALIAAAGPELA